VIINQLIEEKRLDEIGLIAVDEMHMLGDNERGTLFVRPLNHNGTSSINFSRLFIGIHAHKTEVFEWQGTSNRYNLLPFKKQEDVYYLSIKGMSATVPNLLDICGWLNATPFRSNFRPVPLVEMVKINSRLFDRRGNLIRKFEKNDKDPEYLLPLVLEVGAPLHISIIS